MFEYIGYITVMIGVVIAAISLLINARQSVLQYKVIKATFWLDLRKMFMEHNEVHEKLRPGGEWYGKESLPTAIELPKVEAYMGLFEHCKAMLDDGLIDWETFKSIYSYRISNILNNEAIVSAKFKNPVARKGWKDFIELAEALHYEVPQA